ncbi:MAG: cytochrome c-type biogenesis protein CcmH [Betaproteobacteria bacterium]|nr:cytochrome c-type biogenesis protein CcmH [Betaproteobacteria bacterium]
MKRLLLALMFVLAAGVAFGKEAVPTAEDPVLEARVQRLSEELRCLVCQNESLAGSRAELANDLRREIRDMMRAGRSDKEIVDFLVQRYGDFVLYRPPVKSTTYLLWFGPFLLLGGGIAVLLYYLKRRRKERVVEDEGLTEEERLRAEAILKQGGEGQS